jgi:hypothetical protein
MAESNMEHMLNQRVCSWGAALHVEVAHAFLECPMNIFYIIGVVVVVILVAGFLGVHV